MATAINIAALETLEEAIPSDFVHILKDSSYSENLSYKSLVSSLRSVFQEVDVLQDFSLSVEYAKTILEEACNATLSVAEAKNIYAQKDVLEGRKPTLLTDSNMNALLQNCVTNDLAVQKAANARELAQKMRDEITDFGAAAMIGILQSSEPSAEEEEGEEGKKEGG